MSNNNTEYDEEDIIVFDDEFDASDVDVQKLREIRKGGDDAGDSV
ncbi:MULTISPECIES: hypothetical protein [unclassified Haloarcula]|nr:MULTISPECIES: hypothetical protein [unclassified Haloarcula]